MVALAIWWGVATRPKLEKDHKRFAFPQNVGRAVWEAKWNCLFPVVALVALFGGFATPVEAAAVTALWTFVVETVVYRDLIRLIPPFFPPPPPPPPPFFFFFFFF